MVIRQAAPTLHDKTSDIKSPAAAHHKTVFELDLPLTPWMMSGKFHDYLHRFRSYRLDRPTSRQTVTDTAENNTTLATLRSAAGNNGSSEMFMLGL